MAKRTDSNATELIRTWPLPSSTTLGSAVRAKGVLQHVRARLPFEVRKALDLDGLALTLDMPVTARALFQATAKAVTDLLAGIDSLPVLPREIEDILTISTTERRRWLDDGRLPSAGIRTVKLPGRARKITFHVFDPAVVTDIQDRGAVDEWREDDIAAAAENRRRAALKAKLTKTLRQTKASRPAKATEGDAPKLRGWADFDADGFLK